MTSQAAPSLAPDDRPVLPRGVRTRFDPVRGIWVLLAPERALKLDHVGTAILAEIDGKRTFAEITAALAAKFDAPAAQIAKDAGAFLLGLAERRMLEVKR